MYETKRNSRYLTPNDRAKIEVLYKLGTKQVEIAREIGVSPAAICRELKKGMVEQLDGQTWKKYVVYSSQKAEDFHKWQQSSRGGKEKIGNNYAYLEALERRVLDGHSPEEAILFERKRGVFPLTISKATFYRYLSRGYFSRLTYDALPQGKRKRKAHSVNRVNTSRVDHRSIEQRVKEIERREEVGHWEMDSVIGKSEGKNESVLVLTERKTRQEIVLKVKDKTAKSTVQALAYLRRYFGKDFCKIFRTITVDNGSEFSDKKGMEIDATLFFWCHPSCPSERGSNECANKLVRRKLPKGQSLAKVTNKKAREVQHFVNNYCRPMFGGRCSNELFGEELPALGLLRLENVRRFFNL